MNISYKSKTNDKHTENVFNSIIESLFEYKKINIDLFKDKKFFLVSFDGSAGADYNFDYSFFCQGQIAQLVIIKDLSMKIFGETVDPRKVISIVYEKIKAKNTIFSCQDSII